MTEQEKQVLAKCFSDSITCATDIVYESLSLLFERMAKHPELSLQEILIAMSLALKKLQEKKDE